MSIAVIGSTLNRLFTAYFRCFIASQKGYDSISVLSNSELVVCSGGCATEAVDTACVPIPLRSGARYATILPSYALSY